MDSFIAAHYVGPQGKVYGLDISKSEVKHAQQRAKDRGLDIQFICADMEKIPLPDACVDVVISNGAFCLAPNKEAAFKEIFRVIKPGGRMVIATSTIRMELKEGVHWPVCMRMFIHVDKLAPMCQEIGFEDVSIDDSNSLMQYDIKLEDGSIVPSGDNGQACSEEKGGESRSTIHVGSEEFKHLKSYDMNKITARVHVIARKPAEK